MALSDNELKYYQMRSNGPGMIIVEARYVNELGKAGRWLSAADDDKIEGLSRLASAIHSGGAKAILQLFASGRQSNQTILRGEQIVSAS